MEWFFWTQIQRRLEGLRLNEEKEIVHRKVAKSAKFQTHQLNVGQATLAQGDYVLQLLHL